MEGTWRVLVFGPTCRSRRKIWRQHLPSSSLPQVETSPFQTFVPAMRQWHMSRIEANRNLSTAHLLSTRPITAHLTHRTFNLTAHPTLPHTPKLNTLMCFTITLLPPIIIPQQSRLRVLLRVSPAVVAMECGSDWCAVMRDV